MLEPGRPQAEIPVIERQTGLTRFRLWIDSVGVCLVCAGSRVRIGGAAGDAEIGLLANLSRRHGTFVREGEGYLFEAYGPASVDGVPVVESAVLRDESVLQLGANVELRFRLPSPLSRTARLEFLSEHRPATAADSVLLMDETCVLGSGVESHVVCPGWPGAVLLWWKGPELWCKSRMPLSIDGHPIAQGSSPPGARLNAGSRVEGPEIGFRIEAVG